MGISRENLGKDDLDQLRALITSSGYKIYIALLQEELGNLDKEVHRAKTWEDHLIWESKYDYLERKIIPLVGDILEEKED